MKMMADRRTLAANEVVNNVFTGKLYEEMPFDGEVIILGLASAAGVLISVKHGAIVDVDEENFGQGGGDPILPDHFITRFRAVAGTRITAGLRETAGVGTTSVHVIAQIHQLG